jgi:hypothetical protein
VKPEPYQIDASQFVFERNHSMVFARMGTGKTLVNLMAMQDWIEGGEARRIMVVAPLRVVNNVWQQERTKWQIPLTMSVCTGELTLNQRKDAVQSGSQVLLVNYDTLTDHLEDDTHGCDAIVFDELSKLRNPTGKRQKAARRGGFRIRTGCTGTPAPNGLTSIYGMAHTVGLGAMVGRNYDHWLRRYFYPTDYEQRNWAPFKDTPRELAELIKPYTYVLEDGKVELPPIVRPPIDIQLPPELRRLYDRMRATSFLSDHEIMAQTAGVLRNKLRQMASGFAYKADGTAASFDPYRLNVLVDIVEEMQGQPLIIAYEFREQLAMMLKQWPTMPWIGGGSKDDDRKIDDWNAGKLPLLGLHPASAGHGLNMQHGGNSIAWWQLPDDLELYDQTVARLVRRGQAGSSVFSYEPCALNTVDIAVREMAGHKTRVQDGLWEELRK